MEDKERKKKAIKLLKSNNEGSSQAHSNRYSGSGRGSGSGSAVSMIVDLAEDSNQSTSRSAALRSTYSKGSAPSGTKGKSVPKEIKKSSKVPSSFFLSKVL